MAPKTVYRQPVSTLDLFPTFVRLAGAENPKDRAIHGVDVMPFLTGATEGLVHDYLYWSWQGNMAVRHGDWKLMMQSQTASGKPVGKRETKRRLYNLADDIREQTNLKNQHPEIVKELQAKWNAWDSERSGGR